MKHTVKPWLRICRNLSAALTGAMLCFGCAEEFTVNDETVATGKPVIVDYVVSEALGRNISHIPLPAHERIKSLTYLLFDENGALLKQREIPGIDLMKEGDWPMRRATMNWEQREALKDTLYTGSDYTAVFIANANPDLFGGEKVLHLTHTADDTEAPALEKVYLSLPQTQPFNDHNMFYLCVREISPSPETDRDTPYDCPVLLQRIVCRTDFYSDDYPEWDSDYTRGKIRDFTDKVYGELIPVTTPNNPLHVNDMLKRFTEDFAAWCALSGSMMIPGFPAWELDFALNVNNLDCTSFLNNLNSDDTAAIRDMLYDSCLRNTALQNVWLPWKGLTARVSYSKRADRFYIGDRRTGTFNSGETTGPLLDITPISEDDGKHIRHTFTMIGFGENSDATSGNEQNRIKAITLYRPTDSETPALTIPMPENMQSFAGLGGNERIELNYLPIKKLAYNKEVTTGMTYKPAPVNIREKLNSSLFISDVFIGELQRFFESEKGKQYGSSIESFNLEISLPDLSLQSALIIEPEWTLR